MSKQNYGGPAFPVAFQSAQDLVGNVNHGMSLRDWFAGQAISGLSATEGWGQDMDAAIVRCAYRIADEAMKAREE